MNSPERVGQIIKEKRVQLGMSQGDLAKKLFVSTAAVSKWERGESYPDLQIMENLTILFSLTLDDLLIIEDMEKSVYFLRRKNSKVMFIVKASIEVFYLISFFFICYYLPFSKHFNNDNTPSEIHSTRMFNLFFEGIFVIFSVLLFIDELRLYIRKRKKKEGIERYQRLSSIFGDIVILSIIALVLIALIILNY